MTDADFTFNVRLVAIRYETEDVRLFELVRFDGALLPSSLAGAHIDLHLGDGVVRQYSLIETGLALTKWEVAVKRVPGGRGGSAAAHDRLRVGDVIGVSVPRNAFRLTENAAVSVLIGGGIGVTPLLAMASELARTGAEFEFYVAHRNQQSAALVSRLPASARIHIGEEADNRMDVTAIVRAAAAEAHLYCCGPPGMITEFEAAASDRPTENVHVERFSGAAVTAPAAVFPFVVEARRSGQHVPVRSDQTVLQALRNAGIKAASSCEQGICGGCEVSVIAGLPDHRDVVLNDAERAANKSIMICCSRSLSPVIVLDV